MASSSLSSNAPLVAVTGATGNQGGSVCKHLLRDGKFKVRAITRDPNKDAARELQAMGAEVVQADLSKKEDVERAFSGAHAVFAVTDYKRQGAEGELHIGKQMVDVAKAVGVKIFIFSTLPYVNKISNGKLKCGQFDSKAEVEEYAKTKGFQCAAFIMLAWFAENWLASKPKLEGGKYVLTLPLPEETILPHVSVSEAGVAVLAILKDPAAWNNKRFPVTNGERLNMRQLTEEFGKVMGKPAIYKPRPLEEVQKESADRAAMYQYIAEYGYYQKTEDTTIFKKIYPNSLTWQAFVEKHKNEFSEGASQAR